MDGALYVRLNPSPAIFARGQSLAFLTGGEIHSTLSFISFVLGDMRESNASGDY